MDPDILGAVVLAGVFGFFGLLTWVIERFS